MLLAAFQLLETLIKLLSINPSYINFLRVFSNVALYFLLEISQDHSVTWKQTRLRSKQPITYLEQNIWAYFGFYLG